MVWPVSPVRTSRVIALIPTGLGVVLAAFIGQVDDGRAAFNLGGVALFSLWLSVGCWLAMVVFWRASAVREVDVGVGLSPGK